MMSYNPNSSGVPNVAKSTGQQSTNNTGSTIPVFMPVKITPLGIQTIDPSIEADVDAFAGVTGSAVSNTGTGTVVASGRVLDTGVAFSFGDAVYVSSSGGVTNVKPTPGSGGFSAGYWVIRLGVIVPNETTPTLKDCLLNIQIVGQL